MNFESKFENIFLQKIFENFPLNFGTKFPRFLLQFDIFCVSKFQFFAHFRYKHLTKLILNDWHKTARSESSSYKSSTSSPSSNLMSPKSLLTLVFQQFFFFFVFENFCLSFTNRNVDTYFFFFFPTNMRSEIIHFSKFYDFLLQIETRIVLLQFKFPFFFAYGNLKLFLLYWQIKNWKFLIFFANRNLKSFLLIKKFSPPGIWNLSDFQNFFH